MKYNKIAFIGMMGSGKSVISKLLAQKLNFEAAELDEIFVSQEKISISEFFKRYGEEEFRIKETQILKSTLEKENIIISTGGGVVLKEENRNLLNQNDVLTIYLKTNPDTIYNRIKCDNTRPLLNVENKKEEIEKILLKREIFYSKAKKTIDTDNKTIDEILKEIEQWIK